MSTHAGVTGNGRQESSEDHTDTDTGTTESDGSGTHTEILGDLDHGSSDFRGEGTGDLLSPQGGGDDLGSLLAFEGLECCVAGGGGDAYEFAC